MMKKITNKTRIKISSVRIHNYLNLNFWDWNHKHKVSKYMYDNFGMRLTSRRIGIYYFNINDKTKYSLFILKHGDLVIN